MKTVFISGPYRSYKKEGGFSLNGMWENVMRAREVAKDYFHRGFAVFCPHLATFMMDDDSPDSVWIEADMEWLRRSDVVVMMKGWEQSAGAKGERELALELGKEIVYQ